MYWDVNISFTQAALGAEIDVPGLEEAQKLTVPKGTQTGEVFRLEGVGVPYALLVGLVILAVGTSFTVLQRMLYVRGQAKSAAPPPGAAPAAPEGA